MSIMYLRSHDAPPISVAALRNEPGTLVQIPSDRRIKNWDLQAVIQRMINATRASGSINVLRILAHGNSGGFCLLPSDSGWVTSANARIFQAFADRMSSNGRVELHSCGSGSDTAIGEHASAVNEYDTSVRCLPGTSNGGAGRHFLQAMADALGVPCVGALNCQILDDNWTFEEPTITVYPVSGR